MAFARTSISRKNGAALIINCEATQRAEEASMGRAERCAKMLIGVFPRHTHG